MFFLFRMDLLPNWIGPTAARYTKAPTGTCYQPPRQNRIRSHPSVPCIHPILWYILVIFTHVKPVWRNNTISYTTSDEPPRRNRASCPSTQVPMKSPLATMSPIHRSPMYEDCPCTSSLTLCKNNTWSQFHVYHDVIIIIITYSPSSPRGGLWRHVIRLQDVVYNLSRIVKHTSTIEHAVTMVTFNWPFQLTQVHGNVNIRQVCIWTAVLPRNNQYIYIYIYISIIMVPVIL